MNFDEKNERIQIDIVAIMDKSRYAKMIYKQKLSDCNIVRNLISEKKNPKDRWQRRHHYWKTNDGIQHIFGRKA